jgi:4-hydroxy-3-polyprenylbenzoate decarboxylase
VQRVIVGISGASGAIYGIRFLEALQAYPDVESHLVLSAGGKRTIIEETDWAVKDVEALASVVHDIRDVGASIASGSFKTSGMVVAPCSIKTLSAVANGYADSLMTRAADVVLKERRRLVLLVRETPLHHGHLRLMTDVALAGGILMPPVPAFYNRPQSVDDIVNHTIGRLLDWFDLDHRLYKEWTGGIAARRKAGETSEG